MNIFYKNSMGAIVYLDRTPYKMLSVTSLFDYEWQENNNSQSQKLTKSLSGKETHVIVSGDTKAAYYSNLSELLECIDFDVINESPGRLYVGDYYISCYLSKNAKPAKYLNVKRTELSLTFIPKSKAWIKETNVEFKYTEQDTDISGKSYPYGYPYNYTQKGYNSSINNISMSDTDFMLTINGPVSNPEIAIGNHTHKINYTIRSDEYVVIDSSKKTIRLYNRTNGTVKNLFRYRDSSHIFDKIPAGYSEVYWNDSFDFDVFLKAERSEPLWT